MAIKCRIWWDQSTDAYIVSSTYSRDLEKFVEALKQFIPTGSREYDPTSKFWYIKEQYASMVQNLAEKFFGMSSVSFTSKTVTQQSQQSHYAPVVSSTPMQKTMSDFVELLPYEAAKRAYLLATQALHPDKHHNDPTFDPSKQAKLNEVWTRIEKEYFKR